VGSVEPLLRQAQAAGLRLRADRGRLVIRGPRSAEPIALALLDRKADVLDVLALGSLICAYFVGDLPTGRCVRCGGAYATHVWRGLRPSRGPHSENSDLDL
jgi:hypothetical protein